MYGHGAAHHRRGGLDQLHREGVIHENLEHHPVLQSQQEGLPTRRPAVHRRAADGRIEDPFSDLEIRIDGKAKGEGGELTCSS